MIDCTIKAPIEGYFWPRRLGGVPRVGDYVEGRTSFSHGADVVRLRVAEITHMSGGDGWTPSIEVILDAAADQP